MNPGIIVGVSKTKRNLHPKRLKYMVDWLERLPERRTAREGGFIFLG
jgi:hypothetical protein